MSATEQVTDASQPSFSGAPPCDMPDAQTEKLKAIDETSAGGTVYRRTAKGVHIGFIRNSHGRWAFAKGHVKPGETLEAAAQRETQEEMGLAELRIMAALGYVDIRFLERFRQELLGTLIRKRIHFFLMEADTNDLGTPKKSEGISNVIWVGRTRALRTSDYSNLRPIVAAALKWLDYNCD